MDVVRVVTPTDFAASRKRDARETISRGDDAEGRAFEIDDEDVVDGFVSHASEDVDEIESSWTTTRGLRSAARLFKYACTVSQSASGSKTASMRSDTLKTSTRQPLGSSTTPR